MPAGTIAAGLAEQSMPRSNGSPIFDAPWQGRALAIAILLVDGTGRQWNDFRTHLISAIDHQPDRNYWHSFAAALESFTAELQLD